MLAGWVNRSLLAQPFCKLCKSGVVYQQQAVSDVKQSVCLYLLANVARSLPAALDWAVCLNIALTLLSRKCLRLNNDCWSEMRSCECGSLTTGCLWVPVWAAVSHASLPCTSDFTPCLPMTFFALNTVGIEQEFLCSPFQGSFQLAGCPKSPVFAFSQGHAANVFLVFALAFWLWFRHMTLHQTILTHNKSPFPSTAASPMCLLF